MSRPIKALTISIAAGVFLLLAPLALAQETKPARIGFLSINPPPAPNMAAFRQGMRDRGHIEGTTYVLVPGWRKPGGKRENRGVLARKLVDRGVDVIVAVGSRRTGDASRAAPSMPIVMASSADPVRAGLIKSLAAPGGNITGMTSAAVDTSVKRMEILVQLVPGLNRIGAIHRGRPGRKRVGKTWSAANEQAARVLGIEIVTFFTNKPEDFDTLFRRVSAAGVGAIDVRSIPAFSTAERRRLVQAALKAKLPSAMGQKPMVKMSGLVSFGPNRPWLFRRTATYVDKILKGAKPADLPVERPTKFDFVINLKTAKALGITVPPAILLRATEVIE